MILHCPCGLKLNAPGAAPGRVGRCPRCGALLRVPGPPPADTAPPAEAGPGPGVQPAGPGTFRRRVARDDRPGAGGAWGDGLVRVPAAAERSVLGSLDYPLRNASGLGLLLTIPPLLWFGSVPLFALLPLAASGTPLTLIGLALLLPQLAILGAALGHALLFLGDVVVTSCRGDAALPRQASWGPGDLAGAWGRWAWALAAGGVVGGAPALAYWFRCGDVDGFDRVVLVELILPGVAYAQLVLVLALAHDTPWAAAHPALAARALRAAGWAYVVPCLVTGGCLVAAGFLLELCLGVRHPLGQAVAFWAWWVALLYPAMVALRTLGLFCHRRRVAFGRAAGVGPCRGRA